MTATLAELPRGRKATITTVDGSNAFRRRIQEMGIVEGSEVQMLEVAPLGDPIKLRVPHYVLAMRREDAKRVGIYFAA